MLATICRYGELEKPPLYRKVRSSSGIETAEEVDQETAPKYKALHHPSGAPARLAPDTGNRDDWLPNGHGPTAVLAPSWNSSVLQSILLNDDAASDDLFEDSSTTFSLTSSTAVGSSSSSSCEDVPPANLFELYQECSSAISLPRTLQGYANEPRRGIKEEWL